MFLYLSFAMVLDILDGDRIDSCKRLVKEYELRVYGKRTGNLAAAALSSGKLDTLALAHLMEVELVEQVFKALLALLLGELL